MDSFRTAEIDSRFRKTYLIATYNRLLHEKASRPVEIKDHPLVPTGGRTVMWCTEIQSVCDKSENPSQDKFFAQNPKKHFLSLLVQL
jgi:hypothetical protein